MDQNNPFAAPRVELVDAQAPRPLTGWTPGQLQMLGWLNLVSLVITLAVIGLAFAPELVVLADWLSGAGTLLGCYLVLRLKAFLEARFAARGLQWPVWLSVALELVRHYWGDAELAEFNLPAFLYFGLMALAGLTILWLGIVLLKVVDPYPSLRVLAWLDIVAGVLAASIILQVVAALPALAAMAASALVFFRGASELKGSEAA